MEASAPFTSSATLVIQRANGIRPQAPCHLKLVGFRGSSSGKICQGFNIHTVPHPPPCLQFRSLPAEEEP